jgi:subtilisin family serine protease
MPDQPQLVHEVARVRDAARRRRSEPFELHVAPGRWERSGQLDYLFKAGEVLVGDGDLAQVDRLMDEWEVQHEVADSLIGGLTVLRVEGDVHALLDRCDEAMGVGVVTPNHVLDVQPNQHLCPATEPLPARVIDRWPAASDRTLGNGVRVAVIDTGFMAGFNRDRNLPWLAGVERYDIDDDAYLPSGKQQIAPYGGHGTFSAGVVLSVAPGARCSVDDVLVGGVVDEATIVRQLVEALGDSPDVMSISAGTYTRKNVPPKAFVTFWAERMRHHKGVAVVAAAGNNGDRQPFWPAAFPWTLSVGSLSRDGERRSEWSNHGCWVDVYAPGEDLVNAFPEGTYRAIDGTRRRFGERMARWSGTSFSTPLVAGLVARRMAQTGENGVESAKSLRRLAKQQFLPGVGPRLLP